MFWHTALLTAVMTVGVIATLVSSARSKKPAAPKALATGAAAFAAFVLVVSNWPTGTDPAGPMVLLAIPVGIVAGALAIILYTHKSAITSGEVAVRLRQSRASD